MGDIRCASCCPAILLAFVGPFMIVFGAIFTDKVIVQPLTDMIRAVDVPLDEKPYRKLARIFYSLRLATERLTQYWKTFSPPPSPFNDQHPRYYPHVSCYRSPTTQTEINFKYMKYLENHHQCITFLAELDNPDRSKVVIKFVEKYGEQAHVAAAKAEFAPKLLYFGPIDNTPGAPSYGGLQMVVMEYVEGTNAYNMVHNPKSALPVDFIDQVSNAVTVLHNHEPPLVFGDLRLQNIMVTEKQKVQLVDFNWASVHDQGVYPLRMSTLAGMWADGMRPLETMKIAHDLGMIEKLKSQILARI